LYPRIHKIHHEFKAPIGMASEYAHPLEFIFSNLIPAAAGPALCQSHVFVSWLWFNIALLSIFLPKESSKDEGTITHHSGYRFPWLIGQMDPR
jgi:sterol desaturase/sphingolipid hydroxylase (fatty acid hydroxylase superfamily)